MKIWTLTVSFDYQYLDSYTCYCDEDPVTLLSYNEYQDTLWDLRDNLYYSYGYLYKGEIENVKEWKSEDYDKYEDEQYGIFCDHLLFHSEETGIEDYDILIDERVDKV